VKIGYLTFYLILTLLICTTTPIAQNDDWWKVKEDQLTYDKYTTTIDKLDTQLNNVKSFTSLLIKSSTNKQLQKRGIMDFRMIQSDSMATFQIPIKNLEQFKNHLSWDMQHIGFPNILTDLKGYGLVSQKQIQELKLENLKLKNASAEDIARTQTELQKAEENLNQFLSKRQRVD